MQKQISSSSSQNSEDEEILTPTEKSPNKLSIPKEKERRKSKFMEQPKQYQRIVITKKSNLKKNPPKVIQKMAIIKNLQFLIHRNHQKKIKIQIIYLIQKIKL